MDYCANGREIKICGNDGKIKKYWLVDETHNDCIIVKSQAAKPEYLLLQIVIFCTRADLPHTIADVWGECNQVGESVTPGLDWRNTVKDFRGTAYKTPSAKQAPSHWLKKDDVQLVRSQGYYKRK